MVYWQLARFLVPLVLTLVVQGLSGQFLNGGMARVPRATETLAAYGLAWGLADFLVSPLSQMRQVGLVLATGEAARRRIRTFVLASGGLLCAVVLLLGAGAVGDWVIEDVHGVQGAVAREARWALLCFVPLPLLEGLNRFYSGLLLQARRTEVISYATLGGIAAQIGAVFALLPAPFVWERPIALPVLAVYAGELATLGLVLHGYLGRGGESPVETGEDFDYAYVFRFFWPLALIMAIQGLSRPLINLFVSRGADGEEALAVLAVVYPLAHMPYGWVNEIRSLPAAFRHLGGNLRPIRRFALGCGLFSFALMVLLFWTDLRTYVLEELIAVDAELAARCRVPLQLFSFFPLAVMVRAYLNGVALLEHRTRALAPSAPSRIGIIAVALLVLPHWGLGGATLGVAALLSGFVLEAAVAYLCVRAWPEWRAKKLAMKGGVP